MWPDMTDFIKIFSSPSDCLPCGKANAVEKGPLGEGAVKMPRLSPPINEPTKTNNGIFISGRFPSLSLFYVSIGVT